MLVSEKGKNEMEGYQLAVLASNSVNMMEFEPKSRPFWAFFLMEKMQIFQFGFVEEPVMLVATYSYELIKRKYIPH